MFDMYIQQVYPVLKHCRMINIDSILSKYEYLRNYKKNTTQNVRGATHPLTIYSNLE